MNEYERKRNWKLFLLVFAVAIGFFSLWYTNKLVKKLADEEVKKVEQWAGAVKFLAKTNFIEDFSVLAQIDSAQYVSIDKFIIESNNFFSELLHNNTTIPVILADASGNIVDFRNIAIENRKNAKDSLAYVTDQLNLMKLEHDPIEIEFSEGMKNYVYFRNSVLLSKLRYYPYIQLSIISLFILVSYLAFSASRRSEQNRVWVGMSKETAHQLGTPISSMMAWLDMLRQDESNASKEILEEMEKDLLRLQVITERFSKIGSAPALQNTDLVAVIEHAVQYLQSRSSPKIHFNVQKDQPTVNVQMNIHLFEWVIENLCKNAIDAMDGEGSITFHIRRDKKHALVDITDTGKGIPKSKFKTVFKPGYTTKKRGWGLGLSLAKRIIEDYHRGQIVVLHSEPGKGTTFRISFK